MSINETETLRQVRNNCKTRLDQFKTFLEEIINDSNNETSVEEIQVRIRKMEENWIEFDRAQMGLEIKAPGPTRETDRKTFEEKYYKYLGVAVRLVNERQSGGLERETSSNHQSEYESQRAQIVELKAELKAHRDAELESLREIVAQRNTRVNDTPVRHFPLPKLDLPQFSGGYEEWLGFRDAFEALIHNDATIPQVQKLRYLRSYLRGEAAGIIENIETSNDNYAEAWDLLIDRYNNNRIIIQTHMQAVFDLSPITKESASSLRSLFDALMRHIRALKVLKEPTESWDTPLLCLVTAKLDKETRKEWEKSVTGKEMPKFDKFVEFMRERCQLLETLNPGCSDASKQSIRPNSKVPIVQEKKFQGKSFINTQSNQSCNNCNKNHLISNCPDFLKLEVQERRALVKKKGLCFNCLRNNHLISNCKASNCMTCRKRHHTLLHVDTNCDSNDSNSKNNEKLEISNVSKVGMHMSNASMVMLSTAIVEMFDSQGNGHRCRVLLDSGSQPNIMTENFAKLLNLKKKRVDPSFEVINNQEINSIEFAVAKFQSINSNYSAQLSFLVLPQITSDHPIVPIRKEILNIPKNIPLADFSFDQPSRIDALIGAEIFYDLLCEERIPLALPSTQLLRTRLGWLVTGRISDVPKPYRVSCNLIRDPILNQLEKFWLLEELIEREHLSAEQESCEEYFRQTTQRLDTGRYMVRLPFKKEVDSLGPSYEMALGQLFSLERRLEKNPNIKVGYHGFMSEYETLEHMELITPLKKEGYHIPHHPIFKESSITTKLRTVFNGSKKTASGLSLNDVLKVGPVVQSGIVELMIRFRMFNIALVADIEKVYRQFLVHPDDRKYQRILWRYSPDEPVKIYQLNTLTYGTASAPYLSTRCLMQLADDVEASFPEAASVLRGDFYVDDMATGADTFEEATQLREDLIETTAGAGLQLSKWICNDSRLTDPLPNSLDKVQRKLGDHRVSTKTLGVIWNAEEDCLRLEVHLPVEEETTTKRMMLSETSQLYDPLGLIAPVIVVAKIEMQQLWKSKLGWDDPIPFESQTTWKRFRSQLEQLNKWSLPRVTKLPDAKELQLHGFADASQKAYGACIYVRSSNGNTHHSMLLCSKSRVAPVQVVSLPRLELCAAVLLAKLYQIVVASIRHTISKVTFWSDSTIVLNWINKPPYKLETFEANRIAKIQAVSKARDWRHVPTKENPADVLSRGQMPVDFIENELWTRGPSWLEESEESWPGEFQGQQSKESGPEETQEQQSEVSVPQGVKVLTAAVDNRWPLWIKYSSLTAMTRIIAYCLRFYQAVRRRPHLVGRLSAQELRSAELAIMRGVQKEEFPEDLKNLSTGQPLKGSKLAKLSPVIEDGLLRVGGRLKNAELQLDQRHPILIPKSHPITTLFISRVHREMMHAGASATLYAVRVKYWIVDGRYAVRKIVNDCLICRKADPKEINYVMGNLPKVRVAAARPFENTGVDFCGHFYIKEKRHRNTAKLKVYAAVFVCLVTKAVHIELVENLTTDSFIGCLRRFFARRGKARALYSDNATNFVGANNELRDLHKLINSDQFNKKVQRVLADQQIQWNFIPPRTPHFGGLWEAAVKALKRHLRRSVGETIFSYEVLSTFMCEIEAILNSRPLTPMSSDPNDLNALTPGHFLIGQSLLTIPTTDFSQIPVIRLSVWQHVQKIKWDLWKRWSREYLNELNVKSKWFTGGDQTVRVGTLVTIRDDNLPPLRWALGRVIEVIPGDDSVVRVVRIRTANGIIERGVKRVCPLPVEAE